MDDIEIEIDLDKIFYWTGVFLIALSSGTSSGTIYGKYLVHEFDYNSLLISLAIIIIQHAICYFGIYRMFKKKKNEKKKNG